MAATCTLPVALEVNVTFVDTLPLLSEVPLDGFTVAALEGVTAQFTVAP